MWTRSSEKPYEFINIWQKIIESKIEKKHHVAIVFKLSSRCADCYSTDQFWLLPHFKSISGLAAFIRQKKDVNGKRLILLAILSSV